MVFYIVKVNGYYQLRLRRNHFCLSSGNDIETRFMVAEKYLKRYRTEDKIVQAVEHLTYGAVVPASQKVRLESLIHQELDLFRERLLDMENKCQEFIRNNTPYNRVKRISKAIIKTDKPVKEEKENKKVCIPRVIRRKVLI